MENSPTLSPDNPGSPTHHLAPWAPGARNKKGF
ncbi:hypothetical protein LEMLEM_LOCUS14318, partial [Lemmus lemmus]